MNKRFHEAGKITCPEDVARVTAPYFEDEYQENMLVVTLNVKNDVLAVHHVYRGTVKNVTVRVGELLRPAVVDGAYTMIVVHNHPSGDPIPSAEDMHITREIVLAGKLLDITVLDHLIVGDDRRWHSMREHGNWPDVSTTVYEDWKSQKLAAERSD